MLTTSERERLAYAEGYPETVALLARLDDAAKRAADNASDESHNLRDKVNDLEQRLFEVMAEREQARDQIKTYQAALMALESEVSFGMRDFIREVLG
jgi:flagellar biosynthesis chaperone FliJ